MAQLVVRNLEDAVKKELQRRARRHGRSMEEEVREILREATKVEEPEQKGLGSRIVALFSGQGLGVELPAMPRHPFRPIDLGDDDHPRH